MQGNKEYDLLKLSRYGSLERKDIKPKVHVANYSDKNIFKRGDLLDANMIINYVDEHIKCGDKKQDPITGIEIGSFSVDGETYDIKIKYASDKEEYLSVPEDWKSSGSTDNGDAIVNIVPGQTGEEDGRLTILTLEHANGDRNDIIVPNTKGDKGDKFTYNDFTPEQLASLKGTDGTTYTPMAGDTTTLPAGQYATVTSRIVGTHVYFDFGIPKGDPGQPGGEVVYPDIPQYQKQAVAYLHSNTEPDTPTGGDFYTGVPSSTWNDGGTEEKWVTFPDSTRGKKIWKTTRLLTSDGKDPQEDSWSEPSLHWEPEQPKISTSGYSLQIRDLYERNISRDYITHNSAELVYTPEKIKCVVYKYYSDSTVGYNRIVDSTTVEETDKFTLVYCVDDGDEINYTGSDDINYTLLELNNNNIHPEYSVTFRLYAGNPNAVASVRRRASSDNTIFVTPIAEATIRIKELEDEQGNTGGDDPDTPTPTPTTTYYWYAGQTQPSTMSNNPTVDDTNFTVNKWHTLNANQINQTITGGTPGNSWYVAVPTTKEFSAYASDLVTPETSWDKITTITVKNISYDIWKPYSTGAKLNVYMK